MGKAGLLSNQKKKALDRFEKNWQKMKNSLPDKNIRVYLQPENKGA